MHKERFGMLDGLRGFALANMIIYHTLYDIVYIFGHPMAWYQGTAGYLWQQSICWCFILLSGFCFSMGSRPLKRGAMIFAFGCAISLITAVVMPEQQVRFGILSLVGSSMMLTYLAEPFLKGVKPLLGLFICFGMFLITKSVPMGGIGVGDNIVSTLPHVLYQWEWGYPLGFPSAGFFSSDYFPLLPWLFLYWTGWYGKRVVGDLSRFSWLKPTPPILGWMGKNSIWLYLVHQPVVYIILFLLNQWKIV